MYSKIIAKDTWGFQKLSAKLFSGTIKNCIPKRGPSMGYIKGWNSLLCLIHFPIKTWNSNRIKKIIFVIIGVIIIVFFSYCCYLHCSKNIWFCRFVDDTKYDNLQIEFGIFCHTLLQTGWYIYMYIYIYIYIKCFSPHAAVAYMYIYLKIIGKP